MEIEKERSRQEMNLLLYFSNSSITRDRPSCRQKPEHPGVSHMNGRVPSACVICCCAWPTNRELALTCNAVSQAVV